MKVLSHVVNYSDGNRHESNRSQQQQQQQMMATRPSDEFRIAPSLSSKHPRCFLTLKVSGSSEIDHLTTPGVENDPQTVGAGINEQTVQVVFELFADRLPKTCENFIQLCKGTTDAYDRKLHYKNSLIYEIIPDWCIVGGDFINNNGTGGMSIYGNGNGNGNGSGTEAGTVKNRRISCQNDSNGTEFEDESFAADYSQTGLLCMLSHGPHTNTSIFFVTLKPADWIKGLYVAFGQVVGGLDQLKRLAEIVGTQSGIPKKSVVIADCGLL